METFSRNIDLYLSSQGCVFHPAVSMGPTLQRTSHSGSARRLSTEKGYVRASQRSQLREKHLCFGRGSAGTENSAVSTRFPAGLQEMSQPMHKAPPLPAGVAEKFPVITAFLASWALSFTQENHILF